MLRLELLMYGQNTPMTNSELCSNIVQSVGTEFERGNHQTIVSGLHAAFYGAFMTSNVIHHVKMCICANSWYQNCVTVNCEDFKGFGDFITTAGSIWVMLVKKIFLVLNLFITNYLVKFKKVQKTNFAFRLHVVIHDFIDLNEKH